MEPGEHFTVPELDQHEDMPANRHITLCLLREKNPEWFERMAVGLNMYHPQDVI